MAATSTILPGRPTNGKLLLTIWLITTPPAAGQVPTGTAPPLRALTNGRTGTQIMWWTRYRAQLAATGRRPTLPWLRYVSRKPAAPTPQPREQPSNRKLTLGCDNGVTRPLPVGTPS